MHERLCRDKNCRISRMVRGTSTVIVVPSQIPQFQNGMCSKDMHVHLWLCNTLHINASTIASSCHSIAPAAALTLWERLVSHTAGGFLGHLACLSNLEDLQLGRPFEFDTCFRNQPPSFSLNCQEVQQLQTLKRLKSVASLLPSFAFLGPIVSKMRL